jgi:NTE family protein
VAKVGLVLSSGGARGAAHVGVLKALVEAGISPSILVGASIGAQVGGMYAAGVPLETIDALWRSTSWIRVARTLLPTVPWAGWSSGNAIRRILRPMLGEVRIEELPIRFAAVVTNLETGHPVAVTKGPLIDAIRASLSVPGLLTPVWLDGDLCVDGGVSCPLPVNVARRMGADLVIGVDVLVEPSEVPVPGIAWGDLRARMLGIVHGTQRSAVPSRPYTPNVFRVLCQVSTVFQKRLCDAHLQSFPPDILIRPDFSADPPCYQRVGGAIEAGEQAIRAALPEIERRLSR